MGSSTRRTCDLCGNPMELGKRRRLLGQREVSTGKFVEAGWTVYAHAECFDALMSRLTGRPKHGR